MISLLLIMLLPVAAGAKTATEVRIGFFEGGPYPFQDILRQQFRDQLTAMIPDGYEAVFTPEAYKNADWNPDSCKAMARELADMKDVDIVVTMGPWVVEDLLEAGFKKPIVAMFRFDPVSEGLVDSTGRPIAKNLTVRVDPHKIETDIWLLTQLMTVKKLGFLYFPTGPDSTGEMSYIVQLGKKYGFEVVTAEGYNNVGTYAFFKAYQRLAKEGLDAVYISPLWGFDATKTEQFFLMTNRDRVPVFSSEGPYHVFRGALASNSSPTMIGAARDAASKVVKIIQGATPADLPVVFASEPVLTVNEATARECNVDVPYDILMHADVIPAPPSEDALYYTLTEAVYQALAANPGYRAKFDALQAAVDGASRAWSEYMPHLSAYGSAGYVNDNTVNNSAPELDNEQYRAGLVLRQKLFSMSTISAIQQAATAKETGQAALDSARLALEEAVAAAYYNYLKAGEVVDAYRAYRRWVDQQSELANARQQLDEGPAGETLRWKIEQMRATRQIIEAESNVRVAKALFNLLLSQPGETAIALDTSVAAADRLLNGYYRLQPIINSSPARDNTINYLVDVAVDSNPDLRRQETELTLAHQKLTANSRRYLPTIGFQASLDFVDRLADRSPTFSEKSPEWSLFATAELPIFAGMDRIRERNVLQSQLSEREYRREDARLTVYGCVRQAARLFLGRLTALPVAIEADKQSQEYVAIFSHEYAGGQGTTADMVDAMRIGLQSRLELIETRYDCLQSAAGLARAAGWSVREESVAPDEIVIRHIAENIDVK